MLATSNLPQRHANGHAHKVMLAMVTLVVGALLSPVATSAEPTAEVAVQKAADGFLIEASVYVDVPIEIAWGVLTDFDGMSKILSNIISSEVVSRKGNTLIVRQRGVAKYGFFAFPFTSEREIQLEPRQRILAKALSGTLKKMESEARITSTNERVEIKYTATFVPESFLVRMFGTSFVQKEVNDQFLSMAREMMRRSASSGR